MCFRAVVASHHTSMHASPTQGRITHLFTHYRQLLDVYPLLSTHYRGRNQTVSHKATMPPIYITDFFISTKDQFIPYVGQQYKMNKSNPQ